MKETILSCCKYLLFGAALIPFLVVAYTMFPFLSWSWRIGIFLPFIVLFLWGALLLLKTLLLSFRAGKGASPAGEMHEPQPAPEQGGEGIAELSQSFQAGLDLLKGSHLKREGDPLYVLPWFLVVGESGSGKSAALSGARLCSPYPEKERDTGTRTCDWSFYDRGIVLDTAGRCAVPLSDGDGEKWRRLLWLLRKHRGKEPVDGVVLTLSADKLLRGDLQEIEEYARQLRLRIDEMTRLLGVTFPVYLLVTKCDRVPGLAPFARLLPAAWLDQPLGLPNRDLSPDVPLFLERFWEALDGRLRRLRLRVLNRPEGTGAAAALLLFPDRLRALRPGLDAFVRVAFEKNHYQETPLLRGIYLGSACREADAGTDAGTTAPVADGSHSPSGASAGGGRGLFLHDFFEKVLPGDRWLGAPTAGSIRRRQLYGQAAVSAWVLLGTTLCGMLTWSFFKNVAVIRDAAFLVRQVPAFSGEAASDLAALEEMRRPIAELERENLGWRVPRFGLKRSLEVEAALKAKYCTGFRDRFLVIFDRGISERVGRLTAAVPEQVPATFVLHLSRRCNLLKARLDGESLVSLSARPLPDAPSSWGDPARRQKEPFGELYLSYLSWSGDDAALSGELRNLQLLLQHALAVEGPDLGWLLSYYASRHPDQAVRLAEFWHGSRRLPAEPAIAPPFTRRGREGIGALYREISAAHPEPRLLEQGSASFEARYRDACFSAWQRFALELPGGEQTLAGYRQWREAAASMAGEKSPYLAFVSRATSELEPFLEDAASSPPWIAQLYRFQALRSAASESGMASSAAARKEKIADRLERLLGNNGAGPAGAGRDAARQYLNALAQMAPVAGSRVLAHQMALQAFNHSAEAGKSPLFQAADAAQKLSAIVGEGSQGDGTFTRLVSGPIAFYGTFVRMETACDLQAQWEQTVLKEVQGASDPQTLKYLLGKDGPVWKYLGDFAEPFIAWSPARGYYAKEALGGRIPFRKEFYSFLAKGARAKVAAAAQRPSYQVTIAGLPTDANREARIRPHGTRLELQCAAGVQVLENLNYPVSRPFIWSPESCGEVVLRIDIGDTALTKRYRGSRGFPEFLADFAKGGRTFRAGEFPGQKAALEGLGVRFVRVNYRIFGAGDLAKEEELPGSLPATVAECWD